MGLPQFKQDEEQFSSPPVMPVFERTLKVDRTLSRKFESLRCLMVLVVIWGHADNIVVNLGQPPSGMLLDRPAGWPPDAKVTPVLNSTLWWIERFISNGIGEVAVPLLFIISGLLLFHNFQPSIGDYHRKIASRIRTLIIPYLLWSAIAIAIFTTFQYLPATSSIFSKHYLDPFSWGELFRLLTVDQIPSQLWYIRTLSLYVLFSPLILVAVTRWGFALPAVALAAWIAGYNNDFFEIRGAVFLSISAYLAFNPDWLERIERLPLVPTAILWIAFSMLKVWTDYDSLSNASNRFIWAAAVLSGLITVWNGYPLLSGRAEKFAQAVLPYSFFVYLFHEPFQGALIKAGLKYFGVSMGTHLFLFVATPVVVIAAGYLLARLVSRVLPRSYALLTGGRLPALRECEEQRIKT